MPALLAVTLLTVTLFLDSHLSRSRRSRTADRPDHRHDLARRASSLQFAEPPTRCSQDYDAEIPKDVKMWDGDHVAADRSRDAAGRRGIRGRCRHRDHCRASSASPRSSSALRSLHWAPAFRSWRSPWSVRLKASTVSPSATSSAPTSSTCSPSSASQQRSSPRHSGAERAVSAYLRHGRVHAGPVCHDLRVRRQGTRSTGPRAVP